MKSIRGEVARKLAVRVSVVYLLSGLVVFFAVSRALTEHFDEGLEAKARALMSVTEVEDNELEVDLDPGASGSLITPDYYEVLDASGKSQYRSNSLGTRTLVADLVRSREGDPATLTKSFRELTLPDGSSGRAGILWFRPIDDNTGSPSAPYVLAIAASSRELERAISSLGLVVLMTSLVALAITIPIVTASLRRGLLPVSRLAEEAASLGPDDLGHRFETDATPREILPVAEKLNTLLARLGESFERERRFSSNASHELRSPLAEIRALAELAIRWPEEATAEHFEEILTIAVEMQKLVEHLVLLARADSGHQAVHRASFDFAAMVAESISRRQETARERGITIRERLKPGLWNSDPILWNLMAGNLIENAARYASPGSEIGIDAEPGRLCVTNHAPQLTEEDLSHLTERFWRKDSTHAGYGHAGLGLALVKAMAHTLGARFNVELLSAKGELVASIDETKGSFR